MIIKHEGAGVVPEPYHMKAVDGPPPVGAILCSVQSSNDRMEVLSVEWRYRYPFLGAPRLEAHVLVRVLPTQEELAEDGLWDRAQGNGTKAWDRSKG